MLKNTDKKILLQLVKDGRQSLLDIAKNVGVTRQTVAKKIEQFQKNGQISSYAPILAPEKFGLGIQAYVFMHEDPRRDLRKENEEIIINMPEIAEFHRIFGEYDSIIKVLVKDNTELTALIKKLHELPGVKETETVIVHSTIKNKPDDPFIKALQTP
jgi:Lrp/AsnC family transcriptional regulator, leucine-responsive regulatory protein